MAYILSVVFLASSIGINVTTHYCGGEYVGSIVNGLKVVITAMQMENCMDDDRTTADNDHCKNINHDYRLNSDFVQGQTAQLHPVLLSADWFHGFIPQVFIFLTAVEEDGEPEDTGYQSPYHPCEHLPHSGLRAPPIV